MMLSFGLGTVAIADPAAEYNRQLALGMPNPNWYHDWLVTLDLPGQSVAWFAANPSFANRHVWAEAGISHLWPRSAAEAYKSGSSTGQEEQAGRSYTMGLHFRNTSTGNTSLLRVGDSWTLEVSGPPNSDVLSVGGPAGQRNRTVLGQTNGSGVWTTSGRMTSAEIGTWVQDFSVGGVAVGQLAFVVEAVPSTPPPPQKTVAETLEEKAEQQLPAPGWMESLTSNPLLLVGGAALVLFLVMGRGK